MIICCEKLLPKIVRIYTNDDWSQIGDFDRLDYLLDDCIEKNEKMVVLFSNPNEFDPDEGISFPPLHMLMRIITRLLAVRHKLKDSVNFNVIHLQDENARKSVNTVLKYYTPANKTYVVESKAEIAAIINDKSNYT
jgi:hypothetical protein